MSTQTDRNVLRELAGQVAEIAARPIQRQRIALWKDFNALRPRRPMVLCFPEGGWRDLLTEADCQCQDPRLRQWELALRRRLYHARCINDDQPIMPWFKLGWVLNISDYGLKETYRRTEAAGSHVWDAPIKGPADMKKLRPRSFAVDRAASAANLERAAEVFGDLLQVRRHHHIGWPASLSMQAVFLRGLEQVMVDIYDNPGLLHELMAYLGGEQQRLLDWLEAEGLLSLNNEPDDYVGSGGLGGTDELPAPDHAGAARLRDLWGFGESQEFVSVSPEHWREFVLRYQLPILERFGLNHYGCCEPLDRKYDILFAEVPRLRRLSISPWCDLPLAARTLGSRYIFSWKPAPSMICAPRVNWPEVERVTRGTAALARAHGCCLEMVMKDTHTFQGESSRPGEWVKLALAAAGA